MQAKLGALIAIVFWGVSFVATKAALRETTPVTLIFLRFALGVALLHLLLLWRHQPVRPPSDSMSRLIVMGFVGVFVHQMLQAHALTLTTAVNTGWLIGLTPIWSAILAAIILKERFSAWKVAGLLIGFAGALLVVTRGAISSDVLTLPSTRGDLLILASTFNWSIYTILGHPTIKKLGPLRATAGTMLFGWLMLLPFFASSRGWKEIPHLSPSTWGAIVFLGIGCSGLGYLFWYAALERVEASRVAALLYLEPLVTLAAATIFLREPVGLVTVIGGVIVLLGVLLVQHAPGVKKEGLQSEA